MPRAIILFYVVFYGLFPQFGALPLGASAKADMAQDYVDMVDPYIMSERGRWFFFGTGKRPFGMVNLFPDTKNDGQAQGGYNYSYTDVLGFCHLHGWMTVGLDVMPTTGGNYDLNKDGWKSSFQRETEVVRPGYHKVTLDKYAMDVEITSTERVGYHRYTYAKAGRADIIVSLGGKSGSAKMVNGHVEAVSETQLEGYYDRVEGRWGGPPRIRTFFVMELDRPFSRFETWTNGAKDRSGFVVYEELEAGAELNMKVAVSFTSIENARLNLSAEAEGRGFDEVAEESRAVWNEYFSRIDVQGGSPELRTKFYTDLWHALMGRHKLNDVNGAIPDYTNGKGGNTDELKIRQLPLDENGKAKYNYYNADSFWLTNFNLNLLWGLGWPHVLEDFANSFLEIDKWGGVLPRGPNGGGYSFIMTGCPATPLIVSAHNLGLLDDWSSEEVMEVIRRNHMPGGGMQMQYGDLQFYIDNGWCPMWDTKDQFDMSGGLTLEWAFNDWCAAQLAQKIGDRANYDYFIERSQNYKNQWDASSGFMRPKRRDGSWYEKFDPVKWYGFVEGNAWTYSWYVPHDVPGLVDLMGGSDTFADMLNHAFETEMPYKFGRGHSGLFDYGNQPSCGMTHLFNHAGKPWLSQYWTRKVSQIAFGGVTPKDGYTGEEDQGQMGALSAMMKIGLFSERGACGVDPVYDLTAPEFDEVTIQLDPKYYPGKTFRIKAYNNAPENCYIRKAKLNGKRLRNSWIYQKDVARGGLLELWLSDRPNKKWGRGLAPVQSGGATKDALWRQYEVPKSGENSPAASKAGKVSVMFKRMDRDENRSVSQKEFIAFWMHAFEQQDGDGDERLTVEEFGSAAAFKNADTDGNGLATKAEFGAMYLKQFRGMDKDQDGQLGVGEL
ncbi:MAG: GH92 family glycosyl hydrolase [Coraliomargarita sp.]